MGQSVSRRALVVAAAIAVLLPTLSAKAESNQEYEPIDLLTKFFNRLSNDVNALAAEVDKERLHDFLVSIRPILSDILAAKARVLTAIQHANCSGTSSADSTEAAIAAQEVHDLLGTLATATTQLETAVSPGGIHDDLDALNDRLRGLPYQKMWINRVSFYCRMDPGDRASLVQELLESIYAVTKCRTALNSLIDKLA